MRKKIYKSDERKICGVCGGIAAIIMDDRPDSVDFRDF